MDDLLCRIKYGKQQMERDAKLNYWKRQIAIKDAESETPNTAARKMK